MKKNNVIPILDIYQAAFLVYHKIEPDLVKTGGRVIFEFPASELVMMFLHECHMNPKINLLDYVVCLRRLRAQMIALRD